MQFKRGKQPDVSTYPLKKEKYLSYKSLQALLLHLSFSTPTFYSHIYYKQRRRQQRIIFMVNCLEFECVVKAV